MRTFLLGEIAGDLHLYLRRRLYITQDYIYPLRYE